MGFHNLQSHDAFATRVHSASSGCTHDANTMLSWKHEKLLSAHLGVWKSRWRSMAKTGGTLCYLPDRVCSSVVATMVLYNIYIDHNLKWQIDPIEQECIITADVYPLTQ